MDLINLVESKYIKTELTNKTIIEIGDLIRVVTSPLFQLPIRSSTFMELSSSKNLLGQLS